MVAEQQTFHDGFTEFINETFELGGGNIANALAQFATNSHTFNYYGFMAGGETGYNYQFDQRFLIGLDVDFDGATSSNNSYNLQKTVSLADFDENYVGTLTIEQQINYLGTLRARVGYLYTPCFLIYPTGDFAYGNVTLDTSWTARESLGPAIFPTVSAQNNASKTVGGWTADAGVEWLFKPNWSAKLEYMYYSLNNLNSPVTLGQVNSSVSPPIVWGSSAANTVLTPSVGTIRIGLSYHFS